jgi:hypothetical protein
MRAFPCKVSVVLCCLIACAFILGCVSDKKLDQAETRIQSLQQKGVPDSLLTEARVLLVQSRTSKKLGNGAGAKHDYDSLEKLLITAEAAYGATTASVKPFVDSLRKSLGDRKLNLTGPQLKDADSLLAFLDSYIKANKWPEAKIKGLEVDATFRALDQDEKKMKELKPKITGTWSGSQKITEEGAKAVEKKTVTFGADGKFDITEERSGLTNEALKEDWKFESLGNYSLKGDTVLMHVTREKCLKQVYENLKVAAGKKQWVKSQKPTYDSTITSGKKDRFMTFEFLQANFKKR